MVYRQTPPVLTHTRTDIRTPATRLLVVILLSGMAVAGCDSQMTDESSEISDAELNAELTRIITLDGQRRLENFILPESDDLGGIPQDDHNPLTPAKVALGKLLFHETALSQGARQPDHVGSFSCATCHHAAAGFQAGRRQAIGDGGSGWGLRGEGRAPAAGYAFSDVDVQPLRSPSVLNTAYQKVMLWSGAAGANGPNRGSQSFWSDFDGASSNNLGYDGLESQAITALSTHRLSRVDTSIVSTDATYQSLWQSAFPGEPVSDELAGLAIAAYERTILANRAPFQRWLSGDTNALTRAEKKGAIVFFGKGNCANCHAGPALSSTAFYALGMPDMQGPSVLRAPSDSRGRGSFIPGPENNYTFKVPQLYNLSDSPFYGHGGTFTSIRDVVLYYVDGTPARSIPPGTITPQFRPLDLTEVEIDDLVSFLTDALRDPDLDRYVPDSVPSGNCIPANDAGARRDLGCD